MSEKNRIYKATGLMGIATGLSRVAGLIRDMVIARLFGAGFATDAFFLAFTIPNLFRRFFAEGSMSAAFVPIFSEVYHLRGREEARRFASKCWTLLFIVLTVFTLIGISGSPFLVKMFGAGFASIPGKLGLTDLLNRVMFPYLLFVSLLALVTGILNVLDHYFLPSLSPLFLNLAIISSALILSPFCDPPVLALALGVLVGGVVQLAAQLPLLKKKGMLPGFNFDFRDPLVKKTLMLMVPGIAGVAIYQINIAVSRLLASFLAEGSVSYLYYAQRLFEFPQGIFIASLAQAVLPAMSRQSAVNDLDELKNSLRFSLNLIAVITIPAAVGLTLCAIPVFSIFFMDRAFDFQDVRMTAFALVAYAPGLVLVGVSRVLVPVFFALKDTRTPVVISFWTLLVSAGLGLLFMQFWQHIGLAAAVTLAAGVNSLLLLFALRRKIGPLGGRSLVREIVPLFPVSAVMGSVVWGLLRLGNWDSQGALGVKGLILFAAVTTGCLVFMAGCMVCRIEAATQAVALVKNKMLRRGSGTPPTVKGDG
ncbi:MAG: murein biosynthesis integral membrane protein MurJ [Deltaproteobacteria bacterium]|nr:murein biosynthesis integral membrane protein MurJ [Deltaproteobacteria bacterium]